MKILSPVPLGVLVLLTWGLWTVFPAAADEDLSPEKTALFLQMLEDLKPQAAQLPAQIPDQAEKESADPAGDPFTLRLALLADRPGVAGYLKDKGMTKAGFTALAHRIWKTWLAVRLQEDPEYREGLAQLEAAWRSPQSTSEEKLVLRRQWDQMKALGQCKPRDKDAIVPYRKKLDTLFEGSL